MAWFICFGTDLLGLFGRGYIYMDIRTYIYIINYIYNIIVCIISTDIYSHYAP